MILVSGPIGAGKTTLCARAAAAARACGQAVAGVLAPALLQDGAKVGIQALDLASGERRLLAHMRRDLGGLRLGPYSFDDDVLWWVVARCREALAGEGLVFVDEIGRLELERGTGLAPLLPVLAQPRRGETVVVVRQGLLDWLSECLAGAEPAVVRLDPGDRDAAWPALAGLLFAPASAAGSKGGRGDRC